jgi:hypothetical protein
MVYNTVSSLLFSAYTLYASLHTFFTLLCMQSISISRLNASLAFQYQTKPGMICTTNAEFFLLGVQVYGPDNVCKASIDELCPICRETRYPNYRSRRGVSTKDSLYTIKGCSHQFCIGCLESWLETNKTCPMCRQVLFNKWQEDTEDMKGLMDLIEFLDIVDVGATAATRMNEGRNGRDTKNPWEMIREARRIIFGRCSGMRTIVEISR